MKLRGKLLHMLKRATFAITSLYLRKYRRETPLDLAEVRSILVIPNQPIGDLLVSSPIWHALKGRKPDLRIGVAVSPRNIAGVRSDPDVDVTYMLYGGTRSERIAEMRRARRDGWDVVFTTAGFFKTGRHAYLTRFIAKQGVTVTSHPDRWRRYHNLYSYCFRRIVEPDPVPIVEQFQAIAEQTFGITFTPEERKPKFLPSEEALQAIRTRLDALFQKSGTSTLILINLEAQRFGLEWGLENSLEFAKIVTGRRSDILVVMTATMNYVNYYWKDFQNYYTSTLDGTGHTNRIQFFPVRDIHELGALVSMCDLVVSPDTSVSHLAAIFEVPILGLYGLTNVWMPYCVNRIVIPANPSPYWATIPVSALTMDVVLSAAEKLLPILA